MENIHIMPTDRPSRLYKGFIGLLLNRVELDTKYNVHIHITSDELLKENDLVYNTVQKTVFKANKEFLRLLGDSLATNRKIILTTDLILIADGIQSIDDNFLEWFIKNPNCKLVKIKHYNNECIGECGICNNTCGNWYKIIIPNEEPQQELEKGTTITNVDKEQAIIYNKIQLKQFAFECIANFLPNSDNKLEQKLVDVISDRIDKQFEQFNSK